MQPAGRKRIIHALYKGSGVKLFKTYNRMDGTVSSQTLTIHLRRFLNRVRPTKEMKIHVLLGPRCPYARTSKYMDGTLHPISFYEIST